MPDYTRAKASDLRLSYFTESMLVGRVLTKRYGNRQIRYRILGFNRGPARANADGARLMTGAPGNDHVILERLDRGARSTPPGTIRVWASRWCFGERSGYYLEDRYATGD